MCFIASPCSQVVSYQASSSLCAPPSLSVMTNGPLLFISGNYRSSVSFFIWKFFFFYLRINKISCYIDRTFYLSSRRVFNFSKRKRVRNATEPFTVFLVFICVRQSMESTPSCQDIFALGKYD